VNRTRLLRDTVAQREAQGVVPVTRQQVVSPDLELAAASPDEQADIAIRLAEERIGRALTANEIRARAAPLSRLAMALKRRADEREALARIGPITLEDILNTPGEE